MNRIERLLITGGLVLISLGVSAQELVNNSTVDSSSLWKKLAYDGASVFGGVKHAYTSPFRWEKDDFVTLGAVTAGTVLLHLIDEEGNEVLYKSSGWSTSRNKRFWILFWETTL